MTGRGGGDALDILGFVERGWPMGDGGWGLLRKDVVKDKRFPCWVVCRIGTEGSNSGIRGRQMKRNNILTSI